jgi:hypothetical protein
MSSQPTACQGVTNVVCFIVALYFLFFLRLMTTTDTNGELNRFAEYEIKPALDTLCTFNPVKAEFILHGQKFSFYLTGNALRLSCTYEPVNVL